MKKVIANGSQALNGSRKRSRIAGVSKFFRRHAVSHRPVTRHGPANGPAAAAAPKIIGIIVFDRMSAAGLMGPAEVFSRAKEPNGEGRHRCCYEVMTIGISTEICRTDSGIFVKPEIAMRNAPSLDTVIIPGGSGIHDPKANNDIAHWLNLIAPAARRVVALGSGIYALARTGLLDERQVITHSRLAADVASRFPSLRINSTGVFLNDGSFHTCAGGISAIDLSLALIEEDYGCQVALDVARELIVHVKRSGGELQYSEPLRFQAQSSDRFADLPAWILSHLSEDLSVETLARKSCMSLRNFTRLFNKEFGRPPAAFVADARINEARRRVLLPRLNLENIAASLGFKSADVFSKAFERHVGVRPRIYRAQRKAQARKAAIF